MRTLGPHRFRLSSGVQLCVLLALGCALLLSSGLQAAQAHALPRRRALLQAPPVVTPVADPIATAAPITSVPPGSPNATDLAIESLNVTGTANLTTPMSTIFAPTDAAFAALAAALNLSAPMDLFNATYNATAANLTALHVIPGEAVTAANLSVTPVITAPTLLGFNVTITREPNGNVTVTVPGSDVVANVIRADVPYEGSIVHVIDKVLLPPANTTETWPIPLPSANTTGAGIPL